MMNPSINTNRNFTDHAILNLSADEHTIVLHAFTAAHGHSQRFYMSTMRFASWLRQKPSESFLDVDLAMFLQAYRIDDNKVFFRVSFTRISGDNTLSGYQLSFDVPVETLEQVLTGASARLLVDTVSRHEQARLHFSASAQAQIAVYAKDQKKRRALSKALRDNFSYGRSSKITLYGDIDGFYFVEEDGICGGLVHHTSTVRGRDGKTHTAHSFSVHT